MEYESALLRAQIDSIKREPTILSSPGTPIFHYVITFFHSSVASTLSEYLLPPPIIVMRLAQASQYSQAMATARSLKVDMTDVFIHLTNQCIRLSRNPGSIL